MRSGAVLASALLVGLAGGGGYWLGARHSHAKLTSHLSSQLARAHEESVESGRECERRCEERVAAGKTSAMQQVRPQWEGKLAATRQEGKLALEKAEARLRSCEKKNESGLPHVPDRVEASALDLKTGGLDALPHPALLLHSLATWEAPPRMPELLSGVSKYALSISKPQDEGAGPSGADEVELSYLAWRGNQSLGGVVHHVHHMGHPSAGFPRGWEAAIRTMKPGECSLFSFMEDPPSACLASDEAFEECGQLRQIEYLIQLHSVVRVEDLSIQSDRSLLKTVMRAGKGAETPADGATVHVRVSSRGNESQRRGGGEMNLQFALGDGSGGEALRLTVMSMLRTEKAKMRAASALVREPLLNLTGTDQFAVDEAGLLEFEVELLSFQQARALEYLSSSELLERVGTLKTQGNTLFSTLEVQRACEVYRRARRILQLVPQDDASEVNATEAETRKALELALLLNSAACASRTGAHKEALALCDAALALSANSTKALYRRGQALEGLGFSVEASAAYKSVLALQPTNKEAYARLQTLHAMEGAKMLQSRGLSSTSAPSEILSQVDALKVESNKQFTTGDHAQACKGYRQGLDILKLVSHDLESAEAETRKALELALLLNSAACASRSGAHKEALDLCDAALALSANSTKALYRRGQALEGLGRVLEASAAYKSVLALQPTNKEAYARLQTLYITERSSMLQAMGLSGVSSSSELLSKVEALKVESNKHFTSGNHARACEGYTQGLEILKFVSNDLELTEAASRKPLELALLLNSAACASRSGAYKEALELCDAALKLSATSTKAHYRRGQALEGLGRIVEASAAYKEVLALQPANKEAHGRIQALRQLETNSDTGDVPLPA